MKWMITLVLLAPALVAAQPKTADEWYKEGENQYNLGAFDKAADAFKQGFALETNESKKPAYLYNVAQAYRQGKECKDAVFFYKRFLALKENDTAKPLKPQTRAEVEKWISELDECARSQDTIANHPPTDTIKPGSDDKAGTATKPVVTDPTKPEGGKRVATGGDEAGDEGHNDEAGSEPFTFVPPRTLSARFTGGASKIHAGSLDVPIQATFNLTGGYPIMVNEKLEIDPGLAFTYTPVPFTNSITNSKKNAAFVQALANVAATYYLTPRIGLRGDLGAGVLLFTGIEDMGNPFTMNGQPTSGALSMFAVRAGASLDYAFTPNVLATITPIAFTYSPAKTGLRSEISSITRLDFMLGVGYRM